MRYSWYPGSRRPRNRLRKRNRNYGYRSYYNFPTGNNDPIYDKDRVLDSWYTVGQTWGCLDKAWVGYIIAKRLENHVDMKLYASVIQRLEKELKIEVNDFPELGLCACDLEEIWRKVNQDDDNSRLDSMTNGGIQEAKDDEEEDM